MRVLSVIRTSASEKVSASHYVLQFIKFNVCFVIKDKVIKDKC